MGANDLSLTRVNFKTNFRKMNEMNVSVNPLTHFPSKIKAFPLSFSARKINQNHRIIKEFHAYRRIN